jgi:hypothetical protein
MLGGHSTKLRAGATVLGLAASLLGCSSGPGDGAVLPPGATGGTGFGTGGGTSVGTGGASSTEPSGLEARAWRLTHEQYRKTVLDLVGVEPDLSNFVPEPGNGKFANFSSTAFVRVDLAANYYAVAEEIAETLSTVELAALTSCDLVSACQNAFITELGERAFRSAVPAEVAARLSAIFDLGAAEGGAEAGYRAVLTAVLNSPLFLYRKEIGPAEDTTSAALSLTQDQIAEFLAFSVLGGPPPASLRERVKSGGLTADALPTVVAGLVADPAFEEQLRAFLTEWLEVASFQTVEKSDVFPGFAAAQPLMQEELDAFFAQSGKPTAGLAGLLLDPVPSVSSALDAFYLSDPSAPDAGTRVGIIGLGAVLASHAKSYLTSPTLRGLFIRSRLFCQEISLPPNFTPPPLSETEVLGVAQSTRELYERHQSDAGCANCHRLMDNLGYALEAFDGAGRFRTLDTTQGASVALNTVTELTDSDVNRPLTSALDLSQALSESAEVKACFARQAFRFYFGQVESTAELAAITTGTSRLTSVDALGELLAGLLSTENTFERQRGN